jgi:hypothetical protein
MMSPFIVNKTRQSPERNRIPGAPLSAFTSPIPVFRKRFQFDVDLLARGSGKLPPLADGGGCELDLFHGPLIA